jgi:hypothetical protein
MPELTNPVELRDQELDLVAAGSGGHGGHRCGCDGGDENTQFGLVNLNNVNVGVNILGIQAQSAG